MDPDLKSSGLGPACNAIRAWLIRSSRVHKLSTTTRPDPCLDTGRSGRRHYRYTSIFLIIKLIRLKYIIVDDAWDAADELAADGWGEV